MPQVRFKTKTTLLTSPEELKKRIQKKAAPRIAQKVQSAAFQIQLSLSDITKLFVETSDFISHLDGELRAHFGLTVDEARHAREQIIGTFDSSMFKVKKIGTVNSAKKSGVILDFEVSGLDPSNYEGKLLGISEGRYTSKNGFDIHWISWVIAGGHTIDDYGILFDNPSNPFDIQKYSKSGEAIMISDEKEEIADFFPWTFPYSALPVSGKNVFREIFASRSFKDALKEAVRATVRSL